LTDAAAPEQAEPLVDRFAESLREPGVHVSTGVLARRWNELVNDGPVTIVLDL
jgi:D-Tyr-tRNAtyr deacylase